jgi:sugar phosphate isomerase/epimerase
VSITVALSSWACRYPDDLVVSCKAHSFPAVEWDLNFMPMPLSEARRRELRRAFLEGGIDVRYHLPYSSWELGHRSPGVRDVSLSALQHNVDLLGGMAATTAILHFGTTDADAAPPMDHLEKLISYATRSGIRIALENTLSGITNDGHLLLDLARRLECDLALDVGHARHARTAPDFAEFIRTVGPAVTHVHLYGYEDSKRNHRPFEDSAILDSTLALLLANCQATWWTCEMDHLEWCTELRDSALRFLSLQQ